MIRHRRRIMKFLKKILKPSQILNLQRQNIIQTQNDNNDNGIIIFDFLRRAFPYIYFTPEFCQFYEHHDYVHSILQNYNSILKKTPALKFSDLIYDELETFDMEKDYFVDLAFFNDSYYLVEFIVHNHTKSLYDQASLFNLLYRRQYLNNFYIDKFKNFIKNNEDQMDHQQKLYYQIVLQFFEHLENKGVIDPTCIIETRDEQYID